VRTPFIDWLSVLLLLFAALAAGCGRQNPNGPADAQNARQNHKATPHDDRGDMRPAGSAAAEKPPPAAEEQPQPAEKQLPRVLTLDLGGGVRMELVLIRLGSFLMGDASGANDAKPVHKVTITRPFYLGKYEVTQEQWQAVMGKTPSWFKGPQNPVDSVGWEDCKLFLERLNEKCGAQGATFSLPTEAQWEYACRAGSTASFCYGDDEAKLAEYAWFHENAEEKTHPVGQKKPNAWGLYDVHGNLFEWCADWYGNDYYKSSPASDPAGPASGAMHLDRGGCWQSLAAGCCAGYRNTNSPRPDCLIGLRVMGTFPAGWEQQALPEYKIER
jgi:formylglycine-generating enzyme required for sulfatase activity